MKPTVELLDRLVYDETTVVVVNDVKKRFHCVGTIEQKADGKYRVESLSPDETPPWFSVAFMFEDIATMDLQQEDDYETWWITLN